MEDRPEGPNPAIASYRGWSGFNSGRTTITAAFLAEHRARVTVEARWMGDETPLAVHLAARHKPLDRHYGVLLIDDAFRVSAPDEALPLPLSDGPIVLEYIRVPAQRADFPGGESVYLSAGTWNERFSLALWLHPDAFYQDPDEAPSSADLSDELARAMQRPAARAPKWLRRPWKLEELASEPR